MRGKAKALNEIAERLNDEIAHAERERHLALMMPVNEQIAALERMTRRLTTACDLAGAQQAALKTSEACQEHADHEAEIKRAAFSKGLWTGILVSGAAFLLIALLERVSA